MRRAWVVLTAALAVHVLDEASSRELRAWLKLRDAACSQGKDEVAGLSVGILCLFALARFASPRWLAWLALPLGVLMTFNGLFHMGMSVYTQRLIPGVLSSPLLFGCSIWLIIRAVSTLRS